MFGLFFIFINIIGILLMAYDKEKSRDKSWRIPERNLILIAFVGGFIGIYFGMKWFRHKTRHGKFKYGVPSIIVLQIFIICWVMFQPAVEILVS
ncbi:MAG: DUF1294 domain-containing protein [Clostridiales bacterium]|nr:DUF1294 domain-containing protein [Clostridiales bacterium]MCF8023296.1 DUF1294 domain-containing protein [Clostridiales bacterium]